LIYLGVNLAGVFWFGPRWCARGGPFEVYSVIASRPSPLRRNRDGPIAVGNPFDHLPSMPVRPGTVVVLAVPLGSTAFDSFSATQEWRTFVDGNSAGSTATATLLRTAGLLVFITVVAGTFCCTGGVDAAERRTLPGQMAHSLIPIVIGHVLAHYLTNLVERGQQTIILLSDPLGRGWNLLGLGNAEVSYVLSLHPSMLATVKAGCVPAGHVAGVVAPHDRALRLLPTGDQLTGQWR
jgi:hypothetical protein